LEEAKEKTSELNCGNRQWLPFLYEVFRNLRDVSWSNLDFPAAEFFNFAANARSFAWDDEFSVLHFAFYAACFDKKKQRNKTEPKMLAD